MRISSQVRTLYAMDVQRMRIPMNSDTDVTTMSRGIRISLEMRTRYAIDAHHCIINVAL